MVAAVDTPILLDILTDDPVPRDRSLGALQNAGSSVALINGGKAIHAEPGANDHRPLATDRPGPPEPEGRSRPEAPPPRLPTVEMLVEFCRRARLE